MREIVVGRRNCRRKPPGQSGRTRLNRDADGTSTHTDLRASSEAHPGQGRWVKPGISIQSRSTRLPWRFLRQFRRPPLSRAFLRKHRSHRRSAQPRRSLFAIGLFDSACASHARHELRRAGASRTRLKSSQGQRIGKHLLPNRAYPPGGRLAPPSQPEPLAMCYELLGQMKSADQLLRESFGLPAHGEFTEFGRKQWPEFLLARGAPRRLWIRHGFLRKALR